MLEGSIKPHKEFVNHTRHSSSYYGNMYQDEDMYGGGRTSRAWPIGQRRTELEEELKKAVAEAKEHGFVPGIAVMRAESSNPSIGYVTLPPATIGDGFDWYFNKVQPIGVRWGNSCFYYSEDELIIVE